MNYDAKIQEIYRRYLSYKDRPVEDISEICKDLSSVKEILHFKLYRNPNSISPLSKILIKEISKDC